MSLTLSIHFLLHFFKPCARSNGDEFWGTEGVTSLSKKLGLDCRHLCGTPSLRLNRGVSFSTLVLEKIILPPSKKNRQSYNGTSFNA